MVVLVAWVSFDGDEALLVDCDHVKVQARVMHS